MHVTLPCSKAEREGNTHVTLPCSKAERDGRAQLGEGLLSKACTEQQRSLSNADRLSRRMRKSLACRCPPRPSGPTPLLDQEGDMSDPPAARE